MARPTKYNQELLEATKDYLVNYDINGDPVPTIEGLARSLNIGVRTIYDWMEQPDKREFSQTLGQIKAEQARGLISGGLKGDLNATIAKLMLCNHGYSDKQIIDLDANVNITAEDWLEELH